MKIRTGLVSNSSSANFIVSKKTYPNVFSLMKSLVKSIFDYSETEMDEKDYKEKIKRYLKILNDGEKIKGLDPDTPVCFITGDHNMCAFSTDNFIVAGCSMHDEYQDNIDGILGFDEVPLDRFPEVRKTTKHDYLCYDDMYDRKYWFPEIGTFGEMKFFFTDASKNNIKGKGKYLDDHYYCTKHSCANAILISETQTAECPFCYKESHVNEDKIENRCDILDI